MVEIKPLFDVIKCLGLIMECAKPALIFALSYSLGLEELKITLAQI
jgi:hypothetical protein